MSRVHPWEGAFSPLDAAYADVDLASNPSAFQRRMVEIDFSKGLAGLLSESDFDWLVVDLIDERLRLVRTSTGYVTFSPEAQRAGVTPAADVLVAPGSDEHLSAFAEGWQKLLSTVDPERIILNRVHWARTLTDGREHDNVPAIDRSNAVLDSLYAMIEGSVAGVIRYPGEVTKTDPDHRWGPLPFHYCDAFYRYTLNELSAITG